MKDYSMKRHVWLIQCNLIEATDEIYIFSSRKKALKWLDEWQDIDDEFDINYYTEPIKTEVI